MKKLIMFFFLRKAILRLLSSSLKEVDTYKYLDKSEKKALTLTEFCNLKELLNQPVNY